MGQPNNPLQMGQTLYEALDATILATPIGGSHVRYTQVVFSDKGGNPGDTVDVVLDRHPILESDILDARAALDMHSAVRKAFVLTSNKLVQIGHAASGAELKGWPLENSAMSCIVGFDPHDINSSTLLLAGSDSEGCYLLSFDCSTGRAGKQMTLLGVSGRLLGAALVRCQLDAHLLILTVNSGKLMVSDVGPGPWSSQSLAAAPAKAVGVDPFDANQPVSYEVASMVSGTSNQQLVLSYAGSDGKCHVAVVGFGDDDGLIVMATAVPDTKDFGVTAERPVFRVAVGDLLVNGEDQLVVAYSGVYCDVPGCAVLFLFELTKTDLGFKLSQKGQYAGAQSNGQPLASIDLHVAVGMFGSSNDTGDAPCGELGVVVLGACATAQQLFRGKASVCSALIPVDPIKKSFPAMVPGSPSVPQNVTTVADISPSAKRFFGFPSDVTGLSVVLGTPTLSQCMGECQLLGIIQAPPFEDDTNITTLKPSLTMQKNVSVTASYTVSSNKTWMVSKDAGASIGIRNVQLEANARKSWGHGFDKIDDNSTTTMVQVSVGLVDNDMLMVYAMNYYVWTYPVRRVSESDETSGSMAVVFPASPTPVQTYMPANTKCYGYTPKSQNGMLLSYLDLPHDGLDSAHDKLLFDLISLPVTKDMSTVTYDQNTTKQDTATSSYNVENSTGGTAHFTASTSLLNYLPSTFGLNLGESSSYSENDLQTTTLSNTVGMTVSIGLGTVSDISYEYQVIPYIYQHDKLGCLMVGYDVSLSGQKWQKHFSKPQARLIAPYGTSSEPLLAAFSRSIIFEKKTDGSVDICVSIFNNALVTATNVTCSWYLGEPDENLNPPKTLLESKRIDRIGPAARSEVKCNAKFTSATQIITVLLETPNPGASALTNDNDSGSASDSTDRRVYWGIYPPEAFAEWNIPSDRIRSLSCAHVEVRAGDEPVSHHLQGVPGTEEDRWRILQARHFDRSLHASQALVRAYKKLRAERPITCEARRLGIVLASERGDQAVLALRIRDFFATQELNQKAATDLSRAILYFPVGRVLKTLGDTVGCLGPRVSVSGGREAAIAVAEPLLAAGRAEQILLAQAETFVDEHGAQATLELLGHGAPAMQAQRLVVSASASFRPGKGVTCDSLLRSTLDMLPPHAFGSEAALIVCSMLGNAGELLYSQVAPRDPGPSLNDSLQEVAKVKGFGKLHALVGSSGGAMAGLAMAHDLIALGRFRRVVVCGVDLVDGALSSALNLLRCPDLPNMEGGAVALLLESAGTDHAGLVEIGGIRLGSPEVCGDALSNDAIVPHSVVLSGLHSLDFQNAKLAAEKRWPGVKICNRGEIRHVGGDVLELICRHESIALPTVVVAAHGLGGDGEFLLHQRHVSR